MFRLREAGAGILTCSKRKPYYSIENFKFRKPTTLIMKKEYYTKEEVDTLISELRKEMYKAFSNNNNNSEIKQWFKLHSGRFQHNQYNLLYDGLFQNNLIIGPKAMFSKVMSQGLVAMEHGIEWIGAKNHCVYMFDQLEDHDIIESSLIERKIEKIFGIGLASKKKSKYKNNLSGLPRDYEKVDNALKPFFESITSDNLAIQDMIDNPDDYGLNDAP